MAQITSRESLEEWLKNKQVDFAPVINARAALRVLPYAFGESTPDNWVTRFSLSLFRATAISWAACNFPAHDMGKGVGFAHAEAAASARAFPASAAFSAYASAAFSASASTDAYAAADAHASIFSAPAAWININHDCDRLASEVDRASAARRLTHAPLWPIAAPRRWEGAWASAASRLNALDESYGVWIDWYNRRIKGERAAFDIPGDDDRTEDKAILARLADATNEDFWDKGATYVNTTLQGWIDEARERVRQSETPDEPPSPTPEAIRAIAAEIASPSVTLTNNQLDVIANTTFDGQSDTANLDEAIAVLRAVVGALLGGLPGNAPRSFAANLTIYDGELAKRDAKPFLGVLVRMEKSVSAGFHADPEMFDAGVTTNFESYFDAHLAFLTHYRRNEEREAKIAQFSIDDAAASGVALTGPVDEVVKEVDALAEQGLVTDGFVQAIKEQQAINYEVALYTSPASAKSGEPTVKERHILQTVGFYERTLAIAANTIAVTTQFAAFIIVLKTAIEALLKFFN